MGVAPAPGRLGTDPRLEAPRRGRSERVYAGLLRAYPHAFRARYADEMVVLFGDQLRDARTDRGARGVTATWFRTVADLVSSAIGEHLRGDRTMATSLATFAPTGSMRWLGILAIVGGVLLLWAFVSWNPFADPNVNAVRLGLFWLGGIAVALAFHRRQAAASPRLAILATAGVVVTGAWNVAWIALSVGRDSPFMGTFGDVGFWASFLGWLAASLYGAVALLRAAWRGMSRAEALTTRVAAIALLLGGVVGTFGMDRLGLTRLDGVGWVFGTLGASGVGAVGGAWLLLGAVLVLGGRGARTTA